MNFAKQKRAIVGLEAAIILIAFVIIAAVFSFMVINQGVFATERGKTVIQEGLKQASTPLAVDGTMFVKTSVDGENVTGLLIPLKAYGVKYVAMWQNTTVVTLKVGANAWANVYEGVYS
jgi:flagellin FlaB